jgi:hypothetical protein
MQINFWNWRPTVALLVQGGVIPDGERRLGFENGWGEGLSDSEALNAATFIETIAATMKPGQRVFGSGEITDKPKDYSIPVSEWDEAEWQNRYSADYELLRTFAEFCRQSGGFKVL